MKKNKIIAVIPARYQASRFPAKLMQMLGDKTVIMTTYQNVVETGLFDEVFVATDSEIIFDAISKMKVKKIAFVSSEKPWDKTEKEYTIPQNIVQKILNTEVEKTYDISTSYNPIYFLDEKWEKKSLIYQNWKAKYFTNQNNSRLLLDKLLDKEEKKAYELQTWWKIFSKD